MSTWLIIVVSIAYLGTGLEQGLRGEYWWSLVWTCYGLANIGLLKAMPS